MMITEFWVVLAVVLLGVILWYPFTWATVTWIAQQQAKSISRQSWEAINCLETGGMEEDVQELLHSIRVTARFLGRF